MPETTNDELIARVRTMRAEGKSPKQIARAVGVPPSRVAPVVRAVATEEYDSAPEPKVAGCWVTAGWSRGLTVHGHADWPDDVSSDNGAEGLAAVIVARKGRGSRVSVCSYLVDVYCLGVKNAMGPTTMPEQALDKYQSTFVSAFPNGSIEAPIDLAQHVVLGAVEYARALGFEPHPDFAPAAGHLGTLAGPSDIEFGKDGKPFYIEGPDDDAAHIMRTLSQTAGRDNFHFIATAM